MVVLSPTLPPTSRGTRIDPDGCIRTENHRIEELAVWLSMEEVDAVLDVVRGRVTNGFRAAAWRWR
jgi:hypothetical protein